MAGLLCQFEINQSRKWKKDAQVISVQQYPHVSWNTRRISYYPQSIFINLLFSPYLAILLLVQNATTVLSDVLASLAIIRQVWGLWKEKQRLRLQGGKDFVTLFLQQVILICEFTLDIRRRNTMTRSFPNQSALELPELNLSSQGNPVRSIQSVLGRFQERIIADMGERSDLVDTGGPSQGEPDPEAP
ncbi:hypothetical protein Clacol_004622 [Clathrus columnatus]|uniref:Uncharacterized protein n=1 Tax=Clathrus columnatus TaxID=1419009 RepID=A0AAV5A6Z3_9AGAM|nr:hypothetical protein Clacol_004622 [Clathrus columnatus]